MRDHGVDGSDAARRLQASSSAAPQLSNEIERHRVLEKRDLLRMTTFSPHLACFCRRQRHPLPQIRQTLVLAPCLHLDDHFATTRPYIHNFDNALGLPGQEAAGN
jgi:hypothetical protein